VVKGVLRRFDRHVGTARIYAVGIEFTEAEYNGKRSVFFGKLEEIARFQGLHRSVIGFDVPADTTQPGVGYFYVEGGTESHPVLVPKGLSLTWLTQAVRTR